MLVIYKMASYQLFMYSFFFLNSYLDQGIPFLKVLTREVVDGSLTTCNLTQMKLTNKNQHWYLKWPLNLAINKKEKKNMAKDGSFRFLCHFFTVPQNNLITNMPKPAL